MFSNPSLKTLIFMVLGDFTLKNQSYAYTFKEK